MQFNQSKSALVMTSLLTTVLLSSCEFIELGDDKDTSAPVATSPAIPGASSTILNPQVSSLDYTVVINESNYQEITDSYSAMNDYVSDSVSPLYENLFELDENNNLVASSIDCPVSGTLNFTPSTQELDSRNYEIVTQDCVLEAGAFYMSIIAQSDEDSSSRYYEISYVNGLQSVSITFAIDDKVSENEEDKPVTELLINDSNIGTYFVRPVYGQNNIMSIYGANNTYLTRLEMLQENNFGEGCRFTIELNQVEIIEDSCVEMFEIESTTGSWLYSGYGEASSLGNAVYQLQVLDNADFEIFLDAKLPYNTIYLQDQFEQTLFQNDYISGEHSSGLAVELLTGTYYIVIEGPYVGYDGDFRIILNSNIQNSATLDLYREAMDISP